MAICNKIELKQEGVKKESPLENADDGFYLWMKIENEYGRDSLLVFACCAGFLFGKNKIEHPKMWCSICIL